MSDIGRKVIEQLGEWITCKWPRNTYVYGKEGEFYIRWTPSITWKNITIQARFTLANITVYREFREQGIFKEVLSLCCSTIVPVIRLECIQNPRLLIWAKASEHLGRKTKLIDTQPPSVDWVLNGPPAKKT